MKYYIRLYHRWDSEDGWNWKNGFASISEAIDFYMKNIGDTFHCGWNILEGDF